MNISELLASPNHIGQAELAAPLALRFGRTVNVTFMRRMAGEFEIRKLVEVLSEQIHATLQRKAEAGTAVHFSHYPLIIQGNDVILMRGGPVAIVAGEPLSWLGVLVVAKASEIWVFIDERDRVRAKFFELRDRVDAEERRSRIADAPSHFKSRKNKSR